MNETEDLIRLERYFREQENDIIDLKKLFNKVFRRWYWFIPAIVLAAVVARTCIRFTTPVYEIKATLLVSEDNSGSLISALYGRNQEFFQGPVYSGDWRNIYNQMAILGSTPVVMATLDELDFRISLYRPGYLSQQELFDEAPFRIIPEEDHLQPVETDIVLNISPDGKTEIMINGEDVTLFNYEQNRIEKILPSLSVKGISSGGSRFWSDACSFSVVLNENFNPEDAGTYLMRFHSPGSLVERYRARLSISLPKDNTSIFHLSLHDSNIKKGTGFLSELIGVYQHYDMERKNENANLTTRFIEMQLQNISDSLTISESRLERFRSAYQMIDFPAQSQQLLRELGELDRELIRRDTQHKYYIYLQDYIQKSHETENAVAPSSMGIDDPLLNGFIARLNELLNEKNSLVSLRQNSLHPTIVQLDRQIEIVRNSLRESITNILGQSGVELENLRDRIAAYNAQIRRLPATERNFVNFERKYRIDSETYTFLLQKLAEAQIAKASSVPGSQVIEEPSVKLMVKPDRRKIYLISLGLGLFIPALAIMMVSLFNKRIAGDDDPEKITGLPIIGRIGVSRQKNGGCLTLLDTPESPAGDAFRNLRVNLNLALRNTARPVIAVLSAGPGEGKTCIAANIAASFALTERRTVIVDLNLRSPGVHLIFDLGARPGISTYLSGNSSPEEIICPTRHPSLDAIPAGPVPGNPAELLLDPRMAGLTGWLKEHYEVIVWDTVSAGLYSDIYPLESLTDALVIAVRPGATLKQHLITVANEVKKWGMKAPGIVVIG